MSELHIPPGLPFLGESDTERGGAESPGAAAWLAQLPPGAIACSAPGRAGIVGNPSDMYGGSVIACSTRERAYVAISPSDRLLLETDQGVAEARARGDLHLRGDHADIFRAVITHLRLFELRAHLRSWSDLPFRAGLAGSTALVVATLAALAEWGEHRPLRSSRHYWAEVARAIELTDLGVTCGYQDQYMATFGGLNYLDFRDKEFYREVFAEPYATVEPLAAYGAPMPPVILAHTGVQRVSGQVHRPIRERWLEGEREVVDGQIAIARLAREGKKALLAGDWPRLGGLMNENHAIQRALGGSGPENERLIEVALQAGALGAKLAGAGQGGTIIALHPEPGQLIDPLRQVGALRLLAPQPADGVRRER
ncbi:MAG: hypothetical protein HYY04_12735 [Chloroflexi bacterium]|nr:hypothetical protein [Chloroflexota bacterium]